MPKVRTDCIRVPTQKTPRDYVPPGSSIRPVFPGESFLSIATEVGIKPPWKLIWYNFPTIGETFTQRGAAEVNWYLENTLGCSAVTADGKNYKFHVGMKRPHIYIPIELVEMPGSTITAPKPKVPFVPSLFWWGGGLKTSENPVFISTEAWESLVGLLLSDDDDDTRKFSVSARGNRTGLNLGIGAGGAVLLFATGVSDPRQLGGYDLGGLGFSAQLGPLAKSLGQAIRHRKALGTLAKLARKAAVTAVEKENLRSAIKATLDAYGVDRKSSTPKFHAIDIPLPLTSTGLEVGLYHLKSRLRVDHVFGE